MWVPSNTKIGALVCCSLDYDQAYLPSFFEHYSKYGVDYFFVILNSRKPLNKDFPTLLFQNQIPKICFDYPTHVTYWPGVYSSLEMLKQKRQLLESLQLGEDWWLVHTDTDERVIPPMSFSRLSLALQGSCKTVVYGELWDCIAKDGSLKEIETESPLENQYPIRCNLTQTLLKACSTKVAFARADIKIGPGNHKVIGIRKPSLNKQAYNTSIPIYHYKWRPNVRQKLITRVHDYKGTDRWWQESQRFLDHLETYNRINLDVVSTLRGFSMRCD